MRRARLSLEEIFLQLTTAEEPAVEDEDTGDEDLDEPAAATESVDE